MLLRFIAQKEARRAFSNRTNPVILIYQMGKVGSRSVFEGLKKLQLPNTILHVHFLSDDLFAHRNSHRDAGVYPLPYHLASAFSIRKCLRKNPDHPIKIITLVREPVSFIISVLFQPPYFEKEIINPATQGIDPHKLINYLNEKLVHPETFDYMNKWFDRELKSVFGIDVFEKPFPVDSGYAVYRKNNVDVLLIRMEDISNKGPAAISDFLGIKTALAFEMINARGKSADKEMYKQVVNGIRLDPSECRQIYESKFVRHFYNAEFVEECILKWT